MASVPSYDISFLQGLDAPGVRERLRDVMFEQLGSNTGPGELSFSQKQKVIASFPRLQESEVVSLGHKDSVCPICFNTLLAVLAEEETAVALDSPAHPIEELGVTRLSQPWQCGHIYCRRDISKWVMDGHDSCPTCRRSLMQPSGSTAEADRNANSEAEDAPVPDILSILEQVFGDGPTNFDTGAFIPNPLFQQPESDESNVSREYSSMYS